jgi:hypothetical protein
MSTPFLAAFSEAVVGRLLADGRLTIEPGTEARVVLFVANRLGTAQPGSSLLSCMEAALLACAEVVDLHADLDDLKAVVDDLG